MINPCESGLPERLSRHEIVLAALEGIDAEQYWDGHVHLIGTGDSDSGIWINPRMLNVFHVIQYLQFKIYLNAACADPDKADASYLERLLNLHEELPSGSRLLLLAFDYTYDKDGERQKNCALSTHQMTMSLKLLGNTPSILNGSLPFIPIGVTVLKPYTRWQSKMPAQ